MKSVALLLGLAISVNGQVPFERLDRDRDGQIQKGELPAGLQRHFARIDRDGSGAISKEEHLEAVKRVGRPAAMAGVQITKNLDYVGNGNERQMLDLYRPEQEEKLPVICWIHGGAWKGGSKNGIGQVRNFLTDGRYAVVSIGYRLTDEAQWPAQIHDCKVAIRFVRANAEKYGLDPDRIVVAGSSAGGHLVAMLGVTGEDADLEGELGPHGGTSSKVRAVVDFFGPKDLTIMDSQGSRIDHDSATSPEGLLLGGPVSKNPEKAKSASPFFHISKDDAPTLIFHGTADPLIPHQQSVDFEKALEENGGQVVLVSVEGGGHGKGFPPKVDEIFTKYVENACYGTEHEVLDQTLKTEP